MCHQALINRLVAKATGESVLVIRRRGFHFANPAFVEFDPEPCSPAALDALAAAIPRHRIKAQACQSAEKSTSGV